MQIPSGSNWDGLTSVVVIGKLSLVLNNGDILTLPELFPGWELAVSELWPPIFTEEEIEGLTGDKGI
jgi:hypothetical protein